MKKDVVEILLSGVQAKKNRRQSNASLPRELLVIDGRCGTEQKLVAWPCRIETTLC